MIAISIFPRSQMGALVSDALEELQHELKATQRALATAEVRSASREAEHRAAAREYADSRKRIERAHLEWMSSLDVVADPIFLHDASFRVLRCNRAYQRCAGIPFKQIIGQPYYEVFPKTHVLLPHCLEALADSTAEEEIPDEDIVVGDTTYRSRAYATRDGHGCYLYSIHILEDINKHLEAQRQLQESERQYRRLFESAKDGILILDAATGKIIDANPFILNLLSFRFEELTGKALWEIGLIADIAASKRASEELLSKEYIRYDDLPLKSSDGRRVNVEFISNIYEVGERRVIQCNIRDITERKATEARIKYLSRVHAVLSGINSLIVRAVDRGELFQEACRIAVEVGEFRMAMLCMVDRSTSKIVPVATAGKDKELLTSIKDLLASNEDASKTMVARTIREKKAIVSNDSSHDSRALFSRQYTQSGVRSMVLLPLIVSDEAVGALALYASEIEFFHEEEMKLLTELADDIAFAISHIDRQEKLNYLAYYDKLTGLANRELFLERVVQYMRIAQDGGNKLALCLIDLERFKNINDSVGRSAGDALLKQVAEWLIHKLGDANVLARIDADHFAMVVPKIAQEGDITRLVEKIAQEFQAHCFHLDGSVFRIAAKAGIALFPDDGVDANILFNRAEAALKKAKAGGDTYLFYTQKMTKAVAGKLALEYQLRRAIQNQEFVLHYQPKLSLASGAVTSAEALIRWNDPLTGLVAPRKFIPVLEETGLIYEVGRWALHKTIADNLRWRSAGLPAMRIAVNVSALQLHRNSFIADVERAIAIDTHAAEGLELEITESMLMDDIDHNIANLRAIRAMGITIAIDDFGTGFSSLSYLSKLPVDTLKIDSSFVTGMTAGPEGLALVSTIISLAHAFKLKVVAEGVETEEQSRLLRVLGCDESQGYLFSRPVPREEFEASFLVRPPA